MSYVSKECQSNLEDIFGSKGKARILIYLARTYPGDFHAAEIKRKTYLAKRTTDMALEELTKSGVLSYRLMGNRKYYTLADIFFRNMLIGIENKLKETAPQKTPEAKPPS